jgi:autotransporter-associated beta strand protein
MQTIVDSGLYGLTQSSQGSDYYSFVVNLTGLTVGNTYQAQLIVANNPVQPRNETVTINGNYKGEMDMAANSANDLYASFVATGNEQFVINGLVPAEGPPYYSPADGLLSALVITSGPTSLTWTDASANNLWDTSSSNWNSGSSNAIYTDGSLVTFNDNNGGNYVVTLNTTVSPGSVTVNNSAGNYVISGSGTIAGTTSLTKSGSSTLTLNTVNTYSGGTNVSAGKLVIGAAGALPANSNVSITGGTLQLGASTGGETLSGLSIASGSSLDVNNNHFLLSYAAGTQSTADATIRGYLNNGYNGGAWNGTSGSSTGGGIVSSAAASNHGYALGYADGADGVVAGLSSGQIEVKYTLLGDANLDGIVSGDDFTILVGNLGKSGVLNWDKGNFLYSSTGSITGDDFTALVGNLGKQANGADVVLPAADYAAIDAYAAANGLLADVPEPTSMGMAAIGIVTLLARRRNA